MGNFRNVLSSFPVCRRRVGEAPTSCCLVERFFLLFPCFARGRLLSGHQEIEEGDVTHFHKIPVNQSRLVVFLNFF